MGDVMEQIKTLMKKKVAGVPVMAIVAVFVVALLYMAIKMKPTPELPEDTSDGTDEGLDGDYNTDQPVFAARPALAGSVTGATVTSEQTTDTNELWQARVRSWLISPAQGYTVDQVTGMLSRYMNGESLTPDDAKMRDKAIERFGFPPEPIDYAPIVVTPPPADHITDTDDPATEPTPVVVAPPPAPPNPNPATGYTGPATRQGTPPTVHVVRGTSDDSGMELARLYYPNQIPDRGRDLIRGANDQRDWDKPMPVGTRVRIPEFQEPKYYVATSATRTAAQIAAKNGTTASKIKDLNGNTDFPVKAGTRVRVK